MAEARIQRMSKKKRLLVILMMMLDKEEYVEHVERKYWIRQWVARRQERGAYNTIFRELALEDSSGFADYMRMPHCKFIELLNIIGPSIQKKDTPMRMSIPPGERLALTLRYLATGESFQSLSFQFRIGKSTIAEIVLDVCTAIINTLKEKYLKTPDSEEKWHEIADLFLSRWNIPNNIGAIDGKRIVIQKPAHAGSRYHDYKGNESIIALVVSGPDYECLYADVGTNGRNPDGHAWARCNLKEALEDPANPLHIPPQQPLPGRSEPVPFVLTGDEAFGLAKYMLRPYPQKNLTVEQRIANYRISRGRRISENILGIMCNRWRCLRVPFLLRPEKVKVIVLAILVLHNWLRADISSKHVYFPPAMMDQEDSNTGEVFPGTWRDDTLRESFLDLEASLSRNSTRVAKEMREEFTSWFNNEGDVAWQRKMCGL